MNTTLHQNRTEDTQNWKNLYLEPHDYQIHYMNIDLRHQYQFLSLSRRQGVRSLGVETSGVERSSCDARVWVLPKRQNKMTDIILDRQRDYLANDIHYPVAFIYCEQ